MVVHALATDPIDVKWQGCLIVTRKARCFGGETVRHRQVPCETNLSADGISHTCHPRRSVEYGLCEEVDESCHDGLPVAT